MKKEIIIIDDDPIYRMIVSITIKGIDSSLRINECGDGKIGLAKLEHLKNSDAKIIVFLDINMPILDGWSFLDEIEKHNSYDLNHLIIYMVSSSIDKEDLLRAQQYGFVKNFLHKPLSMEDINTIVGVD